MKMLIFIFVCVPFQDVFICQYQNKTDTQILREAAVETDLALATQMRRLGIKSKDGITPEQRIDLLEDRMTKLENDFFLYKGKKR